MAKAATKQEDLSKYASGSFQAIIDKCEGCGRIVEVEANKFCQTFTVPSAKWRLGFCNFATHAKPEIVAAAVKINPLKASKRAAAKSKK
ncbi:PxxKW family cysteine-rich protein [Desulfurivibrio sp. D14AmB]|uniref:PxxKW family cysteine-rich protein n=1 Tax=Desulfurivibrio sp. D14AmB TaxID=3374370 RepID=UPI00376EE72E